MSEISFLTPQPLKNKKAIRLPLWHSKMKKPWGFIDHPWLPTPPIGIGFMGDIYQNKNKKSRSKTFLFPSCEGIIKHKGPKLSRGNLTFQ
jgi:hypothetical protein